MKDAETKDCIFFYMYNFQIPLQIDQVSNKLNQILHLTSCILTDLKTRFRVNEKTISFSEQLY